jgi:hypothetical protein
MRHHVFIDNSNIFHGAKHAAANSEKHVPSCAVRINFKNLVALIEGGQVIGTRVLAGSVPPGNDALWRYAQELSYDTDLLQRVETEDGRFAEQGVDELLHLKIANVLLDADDAEVLVLATGDGRLSGYNTSFPLQAQRALKRGWRVEVWSWREGLSNAFSSLADAHPDRLRVHTLNRFYRSLTFVQADRYGPPLLPKVVNVAGRPPEILPKGIKVY